ncbi:hypothetical protein CVX18_23685 [Salmonella enterica]|nr:hypothetical protein [Salmonella enterica]ECC3907846.1 hypothetical protein [Salmonella enterica]EDL5797933.1 hypothetical protein [Salmonella enterica]
MEKTKFVYPRSPLESLLTEKALAIVNDSGSHAFFDSLLEKNPDAFPVKNVCAKLSVQLSDRIDEVCDLLGVSKRKFIETALVDALARADGIIEREGVRQSLMPEGD